MKSLLSLGLIRPSTSPWASPVVLVPKKYGTRRLCVDYRRLNKVTKPDPFPMLRVDELIDRIGMARYITIFDLTKGYYQIPVHQDSIEKTTFVTPVGKYEFIVMPFGLMGAPSVFQWLMNVVLSEYIPFSSAYIDDVAVYSQTFKERLHHVNLVLSQLKKYGLTVKPSKCQLATREGKYLGHWVQSVATLQKAPCMPADEWDTHHPFQS